jgi:hypothetical protein
MLTLGEVYFAPPSSFNDPFDSRLTLNFSPPPNDWTHMARAMLPHNEAWEKVVDEFDKAGRHVEEDLLSLYESKLYNEVGIFSLSERNDDILMWSHYADCHKGICFQFSITPESPFHPPPQPVVYQERCPSLNAFQSTFDEQASAAFLTKAKHWEYEKEWRIVDYDNGPGLRICNPKLITAVVLGWKTSEDDEQMVRSWLRETGHPASLYRAVAIIGTYQLSLSNAPGLYPTAPVSL